MDKNNNEEEYGKKPEKVKKKGNGVSAEKAREQ